MPAENRRHDLGDTEGFVLIWVLLVVGLTSALVIAMTMAIRSDREKAAIERRLVQASALADAGITQVVAALEAQDAPFLSSHSTPTRWRFAGQDISVSLVPETGKVDLNSGDADLIVNTLHTVVRDENMVERLVRRLAALRSTGQDLETVRGLLDPYDRSDLLARELEKVFTVWTNLRGVDPRFAPSDVLRSIPGLQRGEVERLVQASVRGNYAELSPFLARFGPLLGASRPIFRARAEVEVEGVIARREALLAYNETTRTVWVVFWRDMPN